jgi:hypothetical protein
MVATILFALVISLAMLYIMYVVGCPVAQRFVSAFSGGLKSAFYSPDKLKDALVPDDVILYGQWEGYEINLSGNNGKPYLVMRESGILGVIDD